MRQKNKRVPSSDNVVRGVNSKGLTEDFKEVTSAAFFLRPNRPDETGISLVWLEKFCDFKKINRSDILDADVISEALSPLTFKVGAILNVGDIETPILEDKVILEVINTHKSHSEIANLDKFTDEVRLAIANRLKKIVKKVVPLKKLNKLTHVS